jgi:hypothetical protein
VTATVAATDSTDAVSASAALGFTKDPVTITASFASQAVDPDKPDVMTGSVAYTSAGAPVPLAGIALTLTTDATFETGSVTVTTAADGSFRYTAPGDYGGPDDYTITSAGTAYLDAAEQHASFTINWGTQIQSFSGTLSAEHVLRFDSCGGTSAPLADGSQVGPLYYQYAARAAGPWKTLGASKPTDQSLCLGLEDGYPSAFRAPLAAGYYRAYSPRVNGQNGQVPAVSNVLYLRRYQTKITSFSVRPVRVARNGKIVVSGRLWRRGTKWLADARQKVTIEYVYHGKTYKLRQLTTTTSGRFSGTFRVPHTSVWLAIYFGSSNQFAAATAPAKVTLR